MVGSELPSGLLALAPREPGLGVSLSPRSQCDRALWMSLSFCQRFSRRGPELTQCSVWEGASWPVRPAELPCVDPRGKRQGNHLSPWSFGSKTNNGRKNNGKCPRAVKDVEDAELAASPSGAVGSPGTDPKRL